MRKIITFVTLVSFAFGYSQIKFEKGYYITDTDEKKEVLIRNLDWKNNPTSFEYKTSENEPTKNLTITDVKEFGLNKGVRYIRETVQIDKSSQRISEMSGSKEPSFQYERLFLKHLVAGKANLYAYEQDNLLRFFFNVENEPIKQLVHKTYLVRDGGWSDKVAVNNEFRNQLKSALQCSTVPPTEADRLDYRSTDLYTYFQNYNQCSTGKTAVVTYQKQKGSFNITLRPRLNMSSLSITATTMSDFTDFGNKTTIGGGVEFEYVFPFNKNKWAFIAEPTYQYYKAEKVQVWNAGTGYETSEIREADYPSIEVPIGIRHYMFLNEKSKLFLNASIVLDVPLDASLRFEQREAVQFESSFPLAFGVGYKYNDRLSAELRYYLPRNSFVQTYWNGSYQTTSFILGYRIF